MKLYNKVLLDFDIHCSSTDKEGLHSLQVKLERVTLRD